MPEGETPYFFPSAGRQLFAVMHQPASPTRLPFVFCHPFGEEKLWSHRVYVSFARELAAAGHPVLRFDYLGNGDSEGEFVESSVPTALCDIDAAIAHLRQLHHCDAVGMLGLRLGATLAARCAAGRPDVSALMLWAPLLDGEQYVKELLRVNLTTQMAVFKEIRADREALIAALGRGEPVNVDGYDLSPDMFNSLCALKMGALAPPTATTLIVQVERMTDARPDARLQGLQASWPACTLAVVQEEPFWKEIKAFYDSAPNLFRRSQEWLAGQ
jgi:exosortase A-associated hydrolase 2